jgi:hypothetical protein
MIVTHAWNSISTSHGRGPAHGNEGSHPDDHAEHIGDTAEDDGG